MAAENKPAAEHLINAELVRGLLADQHPDLAALPLRKLAEGWDNVIFRLGDALCVRLPRRQLGAEVFAERFGGVAGHAYEQGIDLRIVPGKLFEPLTWSKPKTVFGNSMSATT